MTRVIIVLLGALALIQTASGHGWYDAECCSESDCREVDDTDVVESADGVWKHLPTGKLFSKDKVRPSKDSHFHVCISAAGIARCIYVQQGT